MFMPTLVATSYECCVSGKKNCSFFLQESLYPQAITKEDIKQLIVQISSNHPTQESRNVWNAT